VFPRLGRRALVLNARYSEPGRPTGRLIVLAFEDVTEKRRAEDAVRASEEQFRTVAESAVEAILTADAWGLVRFINPAAQRMFDWNAEELAGQPLGVLVPELGTAEGRESARLAAAFESDAAPAVFETYGVRRDGSPVPLEVSLADWRSRQQQYLTVVARDVSLRKAAEERLMRSELQLEHAQALAHVGSWSWDSNRRELVGSRELFRIHGLEPRPGPQPEALFLERIHPRDRARFEASARRVLRTREPARLYYRIIRSDGTVRWIHSLAQQDAVGNGHWTVSGIAEDVTGRVRALRKIRRLNAELERRVGERTAQLERSNLDLQQFAYVAAHDLQEPLRTVAAFTQLLARRYRGRLDADADEIIGFATDGAVWMHRLIEDLLLYSRVGAEELVPVSVETSAIVARAINNLSTSILEARATVRHDPLPRVEADASLLTLLFQNLIGNAVKFHGAAAPEVHIQAERSVSGWTLVVRDNGIGIPPHSMRRIFDIFQRLHTREEFPGTGIGLAICRRIIERHGGRIWAESEPGRGSTFYFTLPTASVPARTVRQRARDVHGAAKR
jgi:PAS domain S-box-containing protein